VTSMQFDPKKPFAQIYGACNLRPGAKFQQGGHFFDVHRRLVKSNDPSDEVAPERTSIEVATEELLAKAAKDADAALIKMQKAHDDLKASENQKTRSAATKASNAYAAAQEKLELLSE